MEKEPKRCWMWDKKKKKKKKNLTGSDHFQETTTTKASSYDDSWEEQAFAEDAAGHLGGCVWPPRSYSCSFCKREFRSAQALGGHMNVHRRDRARLKHESFKPQMENHQIPAINNPFTSFTDPRHPSQPVCDLVYNPNPKSSSSCLAALPTQNLVESDHKAMRNDSAEATHSPINLHKWHQGTDLSRMTCDLRAETYRSQQKAQTTNSTDAKDDAVCCKRKRTDAPSSVAFFFRSSAQLGEHYVKSEVLGLSHSSIDDLDLELRLGGGGRPKPKLK